MSNSKEKNTMLRQMYYIGDKSGESQFISEVTS